MRNWAPAAALALTVVAVAGPDDLPDLTLLLLAAVAYGCGTSASSLAGAVAAALLLATLLVLHDESWVPIAFCVVGPYAAGRGVRARRALVRALAARNRELAAAEAEHAALAVQAERARIARELHDIVSHTLAVIAVQAGAGRLSAPEPPDRATARFAAIGTAGRRALVEMERLADVLRPAGSGDRIREVLAQAEAAGLRIHAELIAPEDELPAELADVVHRIVQEGVTNTLRHAPGAELHVVIDASGDDLVIELRDTGPAGVGRPGAGAGFGLVGLRERVAEAGGRLEAGPAPAGGWYLRAELPVPTPVG